MKKMLLTITILIVSATSAFALDYQIVKETLAGMTKSEKENYLNSIKGQTINLTGSVIDVKKKRGICVVRVKTEDPIIPTVDVYRTNVSVTCDAVAVLNKGDSISFNAQINKFVIN